MSLQTHAGHPVLRWMTGDAGFVYQVQPIPKPSTFALAWVASTIGLAIKRLTKRSLRLPYSAAA
jgi:hypothetical protein